MLPRATSGAKLDFLMNVSSINVIVIVDEIVIMNTKQPKFPAMLSCHRANENIITFRLFIDNIQSHIRHMYDGWAQIHAIEHLCTFAANIFLSVL